MIQIHSTGTPVLVSTVAVGDKIIVDGSVITVECIINHGRGFRMLAGETIMGAWHESMWDNDIVHLAQEESLDNPATAMELFLALREKGAI